MNNKQGRQKENNETGFVLKQATMADAPAKVETFYGVRPTLVIGEGTTEDEIDRGTMAEYALRAVGEMEIELSNKFEDQFVSPYLARIFPWSLKFDCGGPEYPSLCWRLVQITTRKY